MNVDNMLSFLAIGICIISSALCDNAGIEELKTELLNLRKTTNDIKNELAKYKTNNKELTDTVLSLQQEVSSLTKHRGLRQVTGYPISEVGFMATASLDEQKLHLNQPIIYDLVVTNIGNGYDPNTGLFTCSVPGTYLFNFNIMAAGTDYVEGSLMVNGNHIVHALSDHKGDTTSWDMGTTNIIIRLNEGDVVSVGIQWPDQENTIHGNKFNTFSGYLLREVTV